MTPRQAFEEAMNIMDRIVGEEAAKTRYGVLTVHELRNIFNERIDEAIHELENGR